MDSKRKDGELGVKPDYLVTVRVSEERWNRVKTAQRFQSDTETLEFLLQHYEDSQASNCFLPSCPLCQEPVTLTCSCVLPRQRPSPTQTGVSYDEVHVKFEPADDAYSINSDENGGSETESGNARAANENDSRKRGGDVGDDENTVDVVRKTNFGKNHDEEDYGDDVVCLDDENDDYNDSSNNYSRASANQSVNTSLDINKGEHAESSTSVEIIRSTVQPTPLPAAVINVCTACGKIFTYKKSLRKHIREKHGAGDAAHCAQQKKSDESTTNRNDGVTNENEDDSFANQGKDQNSSSQNKDTDSSSQNKNESSAQQAKDTISTSYNTVKDTTSALPSYSRPTAKTKVKPKFACMDCEQRFTAKSLLTRHRDEKHPAMNKAFKCPECGMESNRERYFKRHRWEAHGVGDSALYFTCKICDKRFCHKTTYSRHMKVEHNTEMSQEELAQPSLMRLAMRKMSVTCVDCGKNCHDKKRLMEHRMAVHNDAAMTTGLPFLCWACGKRFASKGHFKLHVRKFHAESKQADFPHWAEMTVEEIGDDLQRRFVETSVYGTKEYKDCVTAFSTISGGACPVCKKVIKDKFGTHLAKHMPVPPFKCQLCAKRFTSPYLLKYHSVKEHHPEKQIMCEDCGKYFVERKKLLSHRRQKHLKVKNVVCQHCGKNFHTNGELKQHFTVHHSAKRTRHLCTTCGKTFANKYCLRTHSLKHSRAREKTLACEHCTKKFFDLLTLQKHVTFTHSHLRNIRPFACSHCGKTFKFKHNMQAHERIHTGELPFACEYCGKRFISTTRRRQHQLKIHGVRTAPYTRPSTNCEVISSESLETDALQLFNTV